MGFLGGISKALFGGSDQKQSSSSRSTSASHSASNSDGGNIGYNRAFDLLGENLGLPIMQGQQAGSDASAFLAGDPTGFRNFANATGMGTALEGGLSRLLGGGAATGMLRSGPLKRRMGILANETMANYGNNYLQHLAGMSGQGLQANSILSSAGGFNSGYNRSTSNSHSWSDSNSVSQGSGSSNEGGLGKMLGSIAGAIAASDRKLKKNIEKVGELENGLGIYEFEYKGAPERYRGTMADEVARIQPEALGPVLNGYMSVDYSKLPIDFERIA